LATHLPPLSWDSAFIAGAQPRTRSIGPFWLRLLAFAVDSLILGVLGLAIGKALPYTLSELGPWGRVVGFSIGLLYFACFDSSIGNGQTPGKRLVRLRVADAHGNTISFGKSIARFTVLAAPFFLNGIPLPITRTPWTITFLLGLSVFGVGGATLYLLVFNRNTRQGLHDLSVGSYVVNAAETGELQSKPIGRIHWVIVGLIFAIAIAAGVFANRLATRGIFPQLLQDIRLVEQIDGVQQAGAFESTFLSASDDSRTRTLVINVSLRKDSADPEALADQIARLIIQNNQNIQDYDLIRIVLIRGFDIGIAHASASSSFVNTPADWRQRVLPPLPDQASTTAHE
jgi:uncharacterized RDD family membrane protein YckC